MFGLFKKRKKDVGIDFSSLGTDMHSHILPGIDDGATNLEMSLQMARKFVDLGFKKVVATPHVMADFYRNTLETIYKALDILREGLYQNNIALEVEAAAEYYLDEIFQNKLKRKEVLSFGNNYVLVEMSFVNAPQHLVEMLFDLQNAGFTPVMAHPERYAFYHHSIENYIQLKDYGCLLQLNSISLLGYYGKQVKKVAEELVDNHHISFLGSDMHHLGHAAALRDTLFENRIQNLLQEGHLNNCLL